MPNTLIPIQTYTLSSATASVTFSNIPQNYTDLCLVISARVTRAVSASVICLTFNGSSTGYSQQSITGNGASASAISTSSTTNFTYMEVPAANATASTFGNHAIYILNYAGSTNKTVSFDSVSENNGTTAYANLNTGIWANTAAITSMSLNEPNGNSNFAIGSTFTLYGISNGVKATGGTLTVAGGYAYHTFTSTGSFLPNQKIKGAEILCVAGGGGGGGELSSNAGAGGGGAGGFLYATSQTLNAGSSYTALVGAGGAGGTGSNLAAGNGVSGSNSVFFNSVSIGGGNGATRNTSGGNGGSGGGAGLSTGSGGIGTVGQGNNGGNGSGTSSGGGGGGAGAAGSNAPANQTGGAGGIGSSSLSTWHSVTGTGVLSGGVYYIAAGGGGGGTTIGSGGLGGGGNGGNNSVGVAATANTGSGGGGAYDQSSAGRAGGAGGSGLIIVRYPLS
jgi:hypothetical protein